MQVDIIEHLLWFLMVVIISLCVFCNSQDIYNIANELWPNSTSSPKRMEWKVRPYVLEPFGA